MKIQNVKRNKVMIVCAMLLICSILFTLMPHFHKCSEMECSVCDFTKAFRESVVLLVSTFISLLGIFLFASVLFRCYITDGPRCNTLVGRKVKLSD